MSGSLELLNAIRDSIGGEYAERIPVATKENIGSVGNTILQYQGHSNSFFSQLLNRISKTVVKHLDDMEDIYGIFGMEELPFGDTIQKIYVDVLEAKPFVGAETLSPTSMLSVEKGTIHIEYTSVDRKLFYKVTISIAELKEAFLTVDKLNEFIRAQVDGMTRSYALDMYIMTSNLLRTHSSYVLQGFFGADGSSNDIPVNAVIVPTTMAKYNLTSKEIEWETTGAKEFLKLVRKVSRGLKFPHKLGYYEVKSADKDEAPASGENHIDTSTVKEIKAVKTPVSRQVVALEVGTMAEIDVEALAVLFHMDKAEIESRMIELEDGVLSYPVCEELDSNGDPKEANTGLYIGGFICDKDAVVRGKSFEESESFKNPECLYINYWEHHWGYMAVSKFADFVPIVFQTYTPSQVEGD